MEEQTGVKAKIDARVNIDSGHFPGIIKAFEKMNENKTKILCLTAFGMVLVFGLTVVLSVVFW